MLVRGAAGDIDRASVLFNDVLCDPEPEARASCLFCGVEGLEYLRQKICRYAWPIVRDRKNCPVIAGTGA